MRWHIAIALLLGTAFFFGMDAWASIVVENPTIQAFVLSDLFWPTVFGAALSIGLICASTCVALILHPARLTGRTASGEGE